MMEYIKNCVVCNKQFTTNKSQQITGRKEKQMEEEILKQAHRKYVI